MIPKKILYCTNFSENSRTAVNCAVEYAKAFEADLMYYTSLSLGKDSQLSRTV
jgi:hypothetical protein